MARVHDEKRGDPRAAIRTFERMLVIDPSDTSPLDALEALHTMVGDWAGMIATLEKKVERSYDPVERGETLRRAGSVAEDLLGDIPMALALYKRQGFAEVARRNAYYRKADGSAATATIGSYTGSGISFSAGGDGIVLFNSGSAEATPRVFFGAATTGSSFYYEYAANGDPTTSPNADAIVSTVGTVDGQVTYLSANSVPQNIGSPGTAVPEPSTCAMALAGLACGGYSLFRRRRAR